MEISGLPDDIPQNELENLLINLLRRVGVWGLSSFEIAACHRLKRLVNNEVHQRVIIRFTNRKRAHECLIARRYLNDTIWEFPDIFIHESLCFKFKDIQDICNEMKNQGLIRKIWTYNGIINIKKSDNFNDLPLKIYHMDDIMRYFPNFVG